jgi:hypothetical protein
MTQHNLLCTRLIAQSLLDFDVSQPWSSIPTVYRVRFLFLMNLPLSISTQTASVSGQDVLHNIVISSYLCSTPRSHHLLFLIFDR